MKKLIIKLMSAVLITAFIFSGTALASVSTWTPRKGITLDPYPSVTRFWSDTYRGHFYTADNDEANLVDSSYPDDVWLKEGIVFYVYHPLLCPGAPPGVCLSVYRFWNDTTKHHFYTISESEKTNVMLNMPEWSYEGVSYAANEVPFGYAHVPLYRFWSDTYKAHFYTISEAEKNNIITNMPEWRYEGVAYYVIDSYPAPPPG